MQAWEKLYEVYGNDCLIERQCQVGLLGFVLEMQDAPHAGRRTATDDGNIKALVENNQHMTI